MKHNKKKIRTKKLKYKINVCYNRKFLFKFYFLNPDIKIEKWLFVN